MQWVLRHLKSLLRKEQMFGTKHGSLTGDAKYKASAQFAKERIPQLKNAIQILETTTEVPAAVVKKKKPASNTKQLNLFK